MDSQRVYFLRELLTRDAKGQDVLIMEFSYENGSRRAPRFFEVPDAEVLKARVLYAAWGGIRLEGYRRGTTVQRPWVPAILWKNTWREN